APVLAAPDVGALKPVGRPTDPREPQAGPALAIGPTKPAAIAPGGIEVVVRRPRHRPQITARRLPHEMIEIPGEGFTDWAGRIGRLGGYGGFVIGGLGEEQQSGDEKIRIELEHDSTPRRDSRPTFA